MIEKTSGVIINLLDKIIEKLLSARFWIALCIVGTVCYSFIKGKVSAEAFLPLAILVLDSYFKRKDRGGK